MPNSRYGDLWDQDRYAFAEVKGAGDSQGVIIRKSQLDSIFIARICPVMNASMSLCITKTKDYTEANAGL